MDLDRLEFEITELLSERNIGTLAGTAEQEIVQQFIGEILGAARPLSPGQFKPVSEQLIPLADEKMKTQIKQSLQSHTWDNRWNTYKIFIALLGGALLCLLIYFISR